MPFVIVSTIPGSSSLLAVISGEGARDGSEDPIVVINPVWAKSSEVTEGLEASSLAAVVSLGAG